MKRGQQTPQLSHDYGERDFYQRILDSVPVPISYIDSNLVYKQANKAALVELGLPAEEVIGRPLVEVVKENPWVYEAVKDVLETGRPFRKTISFVAADASAEKYFTVGYVPDIDDDGEIRGVLTKALDVTELEDSRKKIKEDKKLSDALNDISAVINSTLDVDEIMARVTREAAEATGAAMVGVSQLEGEHWVLKYAHNYPEHLKERRFDPSEVRLSVIAAETKKPVVVRDIYEDPLVNRELMESVGVRSLVAVPLLLRDGVLGVFSLQFSIAPLPLGDALVDFAKKLALAVSLAIENSRLFAAEQRAREKEAERSKQLEAIHETTVVSTSSLNILEVSRRVLDGLAERFDLLFANLFVADEEREVLLPIASAGYPPKLLGRIGPVGIDSPCESARVFRSGSPRVFPDLCGGRSADDDSVEWLKAFEEHAGKQLASCIVLPLVAYRKTMGTLNLGWSTPRGFSDEDIDFFMSIAHETAVGLENSRLHGCTEDELSRTRLLQDVAFVGATEASVKAIGDRLFECLRRHMQIKAGDLKVLDPKRQVLNIVSAFGYSPQTIDHVRELPIDAPGFLASEAVRRSAILTHNDENLTPERIAWLRHAGLEGTRYIAAPLVYMGKTTGVFSLVFKGKRDFTESELGLFNAIRYIIGQAVEHTRIYEAEHHIAQTLQKILLSEPEQIGGIDYASLYESATEAAQVGGDFYDIFELEPGNVAVVIGDVSGKGIEATALTAVVRNGIKAYAYQGDPPDVVLAKANDLTLKAGQETEFVTAFFGVIDLASGRLTYSSAGHPPVLLKRKSGDVEKLRTGSLVLGAFEGPGCYAVETIGIDRGDQLVLYTDGVVEARREGDFYGEERLIATLKRCGRSSAAELLDEVMDDLRKFTGGVLLDDIALLAVSS